MRWDCPHCHTQLTVADDTLQTGWSFSRCFQCGGFSLVRKSDVNLIKVDHAPNGERVVPTERLMEPKALIPSNPRLETKPAIRPATRTPQKPSPLTAIALPAPTAPTSAPPRRWSWSTIAVAAASIATLVSGGLLYLEGQALWAKAKLQASVASRETVQQAPAIAANPESKSESNPIREQLSVTASAPVTPPAPVQPLENDNSGKLRVKIRTTYANLRTGPSLDFQVSGMLSQGTELEVIDFEDRWFKVQPAGSNSKPNWIRNDMVQIAYR